MPRPKKPEKSDQANSLEALREALARKGLHLFRGNELETCQHIRRPFGIPSVDIEIGGGPGGGAITVLYGPECAGKTLFAIWCLAEAQRKYGDEFKGLVLSLGLPLDKAYARIQGLKLPFSPGEEERYKALYRALNGTDPSPKQLKEVGGSRGNVHFLVVDSNVPKALERALDGFISLVSTGTYQVAVVDDVGALAPTDIAEYDFGDRNEPKRGYYARPITLFVQKLQKFLQYSRGRFNDTAVLMTVQVRVEQTTGNYVLPFGKCLRHNMACGIRLTKKVSEALPGDEANKQYISWRITKGKYGHSEGASGVLPFSPIAGIDRYLDLAKTAVRYGTIIQKGPVFIYGDTKISGGYQGVANWLHEDESRYKEVLKATFAQKGILI